MPWNGTKSNLICCVTYLQRSTGVPVLQRSALVVLRVDCKRRFGQQQHSQGILFRENNFDQK